VAASRRALVAFLAARLTEELAQLWHRELDTARPTPRPGLAGQLDVVDELLAHLGADRLPERRDLDVLLYGYRGHPDFDPAWVAVR